VSASRATVLDIFRSLDRSNCGACGAPTCLAFAALVVQGRKKLAHCPRLGAEAGERFASLPDERREVEQRLAEARLYLKEKISAIDFGASPERLQARLVDDKLAIKCLGRDFMLDRQGEMTSELHANFWVYVPLLNYVLHCRGRELTGEWVKFDQLRDAMSRSDFFSMRCENELRRLADEHGELFFDVLSLFGRDAGELGFAADRTVLLHPLPRVPFLLSYARAEGAFASHLSLYFDRATDDNLDIESVFVLGMGLVEMFKRIVARHA